MLLAKELLEAWMAIWLIVLLLESAFVQLLQAECAHKMLGVEFPEHGGDAATGDWLRAAST